MRGGTTIAGIRASNQAVALEENILFKVSILPCQASPGAGIGASGS
jgi:hypothetical protein